MRVCKKFVFFILLFTPFLANSASFDSAGTYRGKIKGIAIGHWGHVGIELDGIECNGKKEAVLLTSEPLFDELISTLLAAQVSQQDVVLLRVAVTKTEFDPAYIYCTIKHAAIGDFSAW